MVTTGSNKVESCHPQNPQPELMAKAARTIQAGGVVCFPTRCLYGLGVDAFNRKAIERVFKIKQRSADKPLLILIPDRKDLARVVREVPAEAQRIMDLFWPGRITIILKAQTKLPRNLLAGTGKVGVRIPGHRVAAELVRCVGAPITGTSANISGQPGCSRISDLDPRVLNNVDLILDAGPLAGRVASTLLDVSVDPPLVLREGSISKDQIQKALKSVT